MPVLSPSILAKNEDGDLLDELKTNIEDALKEYNELDLLVELLQNALDAIDLRRYIAICQVCEREHGSVETINSWNQAVLESLQKDYDAYHNMDSPSKRAVYYQECQDDEKRRSSWWKILSNHLGGSPDDLATVASDIKPSLEVIVRKGPPYWIEVVDNGIGISDIVKSFVHRSSGKRPSHSRPRRLGVRGNHGWGLTAILGMSDFVEVLSRPEGCSPKAYRFEHYASFVNGGASHPVNTLLDSNDPNEVGDQFVETLRASRTIGTHIRVRVSDTTSTNLLGNTLANYTDEKFINLLQLYTPIGQVNDYVLHPAYHTVRRNDLSVVLTRVDDSNRTTRRVDFDFFRLSGRTSLGHYDYNQYVNAHFPRGKSVHTIHRSRSGTNDVYLSAADIQAAEEVHKVEDQLQQANALPSYVNEEGKEIFRVPRGFQTALSGGMRSEYLAREPRSTGAAFRGIVLAETARPTLGRKYVMDQRTAIPRAAADHEATYDDLRRSVLPVAEPPPATPAAARWTRDFHQGVVTDLREDQPLSGSLGVWATNQSREARVMLAFGDLLGRGVFGDFKILRAHLQDRYDFAFLYRVNIGVSSVPTQHVAEPLSSGGYAILDRRGNFQRYGIGEFKALGEALLDDFSNTEPRKMPNTPDLLVCWSFNKLAVEQGPWTVEDANPSNTEFLAQTHTFIPQRGEIKRERNLPVISLSSVIERLVAQSVIDPSVIRSFFWTPPLCKKRGIILSKKANLCLLVNAALFPPSSKPKWFCPC